MTNIAVPQVAYMYRLVPEIADIHTSVQLAGYNTPAAPQAVDSFDNSVFGRPAEHIGHKPAEWAAAEYFAAGLRIAC